MRSQTHLCLSLIIGLTSWEWVGEPDILLHVSTNLVRIGLVRHGLVRHGLVGLGLVRSLTNRFQPFHLSLISECGEAVLDLPQHCLTSIA